MSVSSDPENTKPSIAEGSCGVTLLGGDHTVRKFYTTFLLGNIPAINPPASPRDRASAWACLAGNGCRNKTCGEGPASPVVTCAAITRRFMYRFWARVMCHKKGRWQSGSERPALRTAQQRESGQARRVLDYPCRYMRRRLLFARRCAGLRFMRASGRYRLRSGFLLFV